MSHASVRGQRPIFKLAVIGDPVAHSKSPQLHTQFLAEASYVGSYEAIQVPVGQAGEALLRLHRAGYLGLNVTTPLKEEVLAELVDCDPLVRAIGAANTLIARPQGWYGANTDGIGLCNALSAALPTGKTLNGLRILVLGTGPTARAAIASFKALGSSVEVWSRTAQRVAATAASLEARVWEGSTHLDAVVATLPPHPEIPDELLRLLKEIPVLIDANYGLRATLQTQIGRPVTDGLEMLKGQARASFQRWVQEFGEGEI